MSPRVFGLSLVTLAAWLVVTVTYARPQAQPAWNPKAAAAYLDDRAAWWATWKNAQRDHGTYCVSCHTTVSYVLARPALRPLLSERDATASERHLADNVVKRVNLWKDVAPFYSDQGAGLPKTSESRGTEAIINALVLARRDASAGRLTEETRSALSHMWALQMRTGSLAGTWAWLNFNYEPWEAAGGSFFGATLAALALGFAPDGYASSTDIAEGMKRLRAYFEKETSRQPLFNRLMALWASTRVGDLVSPSERQAIVDTALAAQQADGGWSMAALGPWKRLDGSALDVTSDGYATGLVTLALQEAGASGDARVQKGLGWLRSHQDAATGQWTATSLNKQRDPASDAGRFMNDAATAFAVLSLTVGDQQRSNVQ